MLSQQTQKKYAKVLSRGIGVVEFIVVLIMITIVSVELFERFGMQVQHTAAVLAQEMSGGSAELKTCMPLEHNMPVIIDQNGLEYVYDSRVNRYRSRQSGRFVRKEDIKINCIP